MPRHAYRCRGQLPKSPPFSSHHVGSADQMQVLAPGGTPLHPLGHLVGPHHLNRYVLPVSCSCFEKETKMMATAYFAWSR